MEQQSTETPPLLIDDRQACARYGIGITKWLELQRRPDFPAPIWLGEKSKRHDVAELDKWIGSALRERPPGSYEKVSSAGRKGVARRIAKRRAASAEASTAG
jgi:predicted DNA-binding transcriptional regulator AlpA